MPPIRFNLILTRIIVASTFLLLGAQVAANGIGFSLTLDYGMASVYFWNGTCVDGAKIEGNQAYKDVMRSLDIRDPTIHDHAQLFGRIWEDGREIRNHRWDGLPPLVCSVWEEPLKDMLGALRDSVALYLPEWTTFYVVTAVSFPVSDLFYASVRSIGSSLSLKILDQLPAGAVMLTKDEPNHCHEVQFHPDYIHDGHDLVLAIEYTQAALTAMMLTGRCHGYDVERVLHHTSFGEKSMSRDVNHTRVALKRALQKFTLLPVKCRLGTTKFHYIQRVILFGDVKDDRRLREVLGEVLDSVLHHQVFGDVALLGKFEQSAFAVARYAALDCRRILKRYYSGIQYR